MNRLSLDRIIEASGRIDPVFRDSPELECEPLSRARGCRLTIKVETANPIGNFKAPRHVQGGAQRTSPRRVRVPDPGGGTRPLEGNLTDQPSPFPRWRMTAEENATRS